MAEHSDSADERRHRDAPAERPRASSSPDPTQPTGSAEPTGPAGSAEFAREQLGQALVEIAHLERRIERLEEALAGSRANAIAIGMLMDRERLTYEQALARIASSRG